MSARQQHRLRHRLHAFGLPTQLRPDDETRAMRDALVTSEGTSGTEVIERAVCDRAQRAGLAARAAFDDAEAHWADVLEQLARV